MGCSSSGTAGPAAAAAPAPAPSTDDSNQWTLQHGVLKKSKSQLPHLIAGGKKTTFADGKAGVLPEGTTETSHPEDWPLRKDAELLFENLDKDDDGTIDLSVLTRMRPDDDFTEEMLTLCVHQRFDNASCRVNYEQWLAYMRGITTANEQVARELLEYIEKHFNHKKRLNKQMSTVMEEPQQEPAPASDPPLPAPPWAPEAASAQARRAEEDCGSGLKAAMIAPPAAVGTTLEEPTPLPAVDRGVKVTGSSLKPDRKCCWCCSPTIAEAGSI